MSITSVVPYQVKTVALALTFAVGGRLTPFSKKVMSSDKSYIDWVTGFCKTKRFVGFFNERMQIKKFLILPSSYYRIELIIIREENIFDT